MDLATDLEKQSMVMFIQTLLSKLKFSFITISRPLTMDWDSGGLQNVRIKQEVDRHHESSDGSLGGCSEVGKPS